MRVLDHRGSAKFLTVREWLESPYLRRLATRVGVQHALQSEDVLDLLQEVRLALWRAGPDLRVNVSWIFRIAEHKAADYWRTTRQQRECTSDVADSPESRPGDDAELLHLLRAKVGDSPFGPAPVLCSPLRGGPQRARGRRAPGSLPRLDSMAGRKVPQIAARPQRRADLRNLAPHSSGVRQTKRTSTPSRSFRTSS